MIETEESRKEFLKNREDAKKKLLRLVPKLKKNTAFSGQILERSEEKASDQVN